MSIDFDNSSTPILETRQLEVSLLDPVDARYHRVVTADVTIHRGTVVGVIGASGGGKSTLALTVAGLIPSSARIAAWSWLAEGHQQWPDIADGFLSGRQFRRQVFGQCPGPIYYISQHARSALIPNRSILWHLKVAKRLRREGQHDGCRSIADQQPRELLERYFRGKQGQAMQTLGKYPRQLSTGECQRAMFAMAMLLEPRVLIADEPFASLDPQTAQVLLEDARRYVAGGGAMMLVTHQLDSLRRFADVGTGLVVHRGEVVEQGKLDALLQGTHASSQTMRLFQLANCRFAPSRSPDQQQQDQTGVEIRVSGLTKSIDGRTIFEKQSFEVRKGERVGIFGRSGGGKTTLARILVGLADFDQGEIERFQQPDLCGALSHRDLQQLWKRLQLTYQDTDVVFDPNEAVGVSVTRGIRLSNPGLTTVDAWAAAAELFRLFGLPPDLLRAPPVRLSGGERKRAAIVRGLALLGFPGDDSTSKTLLLDEPTVGVDLVHQGVIATALIEAQRRLELTLVIFSHDHGFLSRFCDRLIGWPIHSTADAS